MGALFSRLGLRQFCWGAFPLELLGCGACDRVFYWECGLGCGLVCRRFLGEVWAGEVAGGFFCGQDFGRSHSCCFRCAGLGSSLTRCACGFCGGVRDLDVGGACCRASICFKL